MENTGPILSGQYMNTWLLVSSILENILTNLPNFLGHHNLIILKNIGFSCGNVATVMTDVFQNNGIIL